LANAEGAVTVRATTRRAATVSIKMMRFIRYLLFLHLPNDLALKSCQVGCEYAGAGRLVYLLSRKTSVLPFALCL
jgi:hypothetical protein